MITSNSEADYTKITEGSSILAKYKDEIWYKGHVLSVQAEGDEHRYLVKFDHCEDTLTLDLCSIHPLSKKMHLQKVSINQH